MARAELWLSREQGRAAAKTLSCPCHPPHTSFGDGQNLSLSTLPKTQSLSISPLRPPAPHLCASLAGIETEE